MLWLSLYSALIITCVSLISHNEVQRINNELDEGRLYREIGLVQEYRRPNKLSTFQVNDKIFNLGFSEWNCLSDQSLDIENTIVEVKYVLIRSFASPSKRKCLISLEIIEKLR